MKILNNLQNNKIILQTQLIKIKQRKQVYYNLIFRSQQIYFKVEKKIIRENKFFIYRYLPFKIYVTFIRSEYS